MDAPNIKVLKKLADACRKAGISHFKYLKDGSFEFTLEAVEQPKVVKRNKKQTTTDETSNKQFESDTLTEEQLMYWSVGDVLKPPSEDVPQ